MDNERGFTLIELLIVLAIMGMLVGINKRTGEFDSVDMKLVSSVVSQAAVFLANNRLYADLQDLLMGVLHALTASIDAKDPYTCGHSQRVGRILTRASRAVNVGSGDWRLVRGGGEPARSGFSLHACRRDASVTTAVFADDSRRGWCVGR